MRGAGRWEDLRRLTRGAQGRYALLLARAAALDPDGYRTERPAALVGKGRWQAARTSQSA